MCIFKRDRHVDLYNDKRMIPINFGGQDHRQILGCAGMILLNIAFNTVFGHFLKMKK